MALASLRLCLVSLFLVVLRADMAACWALNSSYGNGVYQFTYDKVDQKFLVPNITQYKVNSDQPPELVKKRGHFPKVFTRWRCPKRGPRMDVGDLHHAKLALMNWCEQRNPVIKSIVVSVVNNVTVYAGFWDYGHRMPGYCSAADIEYVWEHMDKKCGWNHRATMHTWILEKYYGRTLRDESMWI